MEYFDQVFAYDGDDLGTKYTKARTFFKIWAPTAEIVFVNLYEDGIKGHPFDRIPMKKGRRGTWHCEKNGDLNGFYYTYMLNIDGVEYETVDPYAKAVGVNGKRGMVVDLNLTNPQGFINDVRPPFAKPTDAVIYELHLRDISMDGSSGVGHKGKFLGLTETGTKNRAGYSTALDHICDLGVTHVQILPCFDFASVDEADGKSGGYNWGYDPLNYFVPEGSYSTDPFDGAVRIREMKEMVMALHKNGIRINMDVVFNHTFDIDGSCFQKTVPDYYYRKNNGSYSNASGCGNETASDRVMFRKYMVDCVTYWAKEYHIDGFRFDLMAVHDKETMREIRQRLDMIDPSIMVYGEGWTADNPALPIDKLAFKDDIGSIKGVGAFNDDIRDGIKGSVFIAAQKGFVNGEKGFENMVKKGIIGDVSGIGRDNSPEQSINYISCHDNLTFWDKLTMSNPKDTRQDRIRMTKLGAAILLTSQGVPLFLAGEEILRSKGLDENSYKSSDIVNAIKWDEKTLNIDIYKYYKGLIAFRRSNPSLRLSTREEITDKLTFIDNKIEGVIEYRVENIIAIFNASTNSVAINLPKGVWDIYVDDSYAENEARGCLSGNISVPPISALILKMQ